MRTTMQAAKGLGMRTTLELPDPLFARLKARAASERVTLKQLLRSSYVEQRLSAAASRNDLTRSAATLPRLDGSLAIENHQLSNAATSITSRPFTTGNSRPLKKHGCPFGGSDDRQWLAPGEC